MPRAAFQVLILPFRKTDSSFEFAVFKSSDYSRWQAIAGGGEDLEKPFEAAKREAFEEAGISPDAHFIVLDSTCSIPVIHFDESAFLNNDLYVIPEYSFGVDCTEREIILSGEHAKFEWLSYAKAYERFTYDSNRTALWELNQKIRGLRPRDIVPDVLNEY
jgi:dATP pyrophosphohydrolase